MDKKQTAFVVNFKEDKMKKILSKYPTYLSDKWINEATDKINALSEQFNITAAESAGRIIYEALSQDQDEASEIIIAAIVIAFEKIKIK